MRERGESRTGFERTSNDHTEVSTTIGQFLKERRRALGFERPGQLARRMRHQLSYGATENKSLADRATSREPFSRP